MGKITQYIEDACGYDENGLPASSSQTAFGLSPFLKGEAQREEDVTKVTAVCNTDAIVDIQVLDSTVMVKFDFSGEAKTLAEMVEELEEYKEQKQHTTEVLNELTAQIYVAERNGDEQTKKELIEKTAAMSVPFLLPTIIPIVHGGNVKIGFLDDPKFVLFTVDHLNEQPSSITLIYEAKDLFVEDEAGLMTGEDMDQEIADYQEEMWYLQEAKRMEEEAYRNQYGSYSDAYSQNEQTENKRMKGVRVK